MIDESSLMKKLNAWASMPEGKKKMSGKISALASVSGRATTAAGSKVRTEADMHEAVAKFIDILQRNAKEANLPDSVMEHFDKLMASRPIVFPDGSTMILITFGGDLHRDSLENDLGYEGVDNIVALFNNGYKANATVYGWWNGHRPTGSAVAFSSGALDEDYAWVPSKAERRPLRFIQQAVADFNGNYGSDYDAEAVAGSDYKT